MYLYLLVPQKSYNVMIYVKKTFRWREKFDKTKCMMEKYIYIYLVQLYKLAVFLNPGINKEKSTLLFRTVYCLE